MSDKVENNYYETAQPQGSKPKKTGKVVAALLLLLCVLGAGGYLAVFKFQLFTSNNVKVLTAYESTFKEDPIIGKLLKLNFLETGECKLKLAGAVSVPESSIDASVDLVCQQQLEKSLFAMDGLVTVNGEKINLRCSMDKEKLLVSVPEYIKPVLMYPYDKVNEDGYVAQYLKEQGVDIADINQLMKDIVKLQSQRVDKQYREVLQKNYDAIDFKKIDSESFEINGKKVNCDGYQTVFTEAQITKILDDYQDVYDKNNGEVVKEIETILKKLDDTSSVDSLLKSPLEVYREMVKGMKDVTVEVYVSDNQLASVIVKNDEISMEWQLNGGDYRMQNMKFIVTEDSQDMTITKKETKDGSKMSGSIEVASAGDSGEALNYSYDPSNGAFELGTGSEIGNYSCTGKLGFENDGVQLKIDQVTVEGVSFNGSMEIYPKTEIKPISGDFFNIATASEDAFKNLVVEIDEKLKK